VAEAYLLNEMLLTRRAKHGNEVKALMRDATNWSIKKKHFLWSNDYIFLWLRQLKAITFSVGFREISRLAYVSSFCNDSNLHTPVCIHVTSLHKGDKQVNQSGNILYRKLISRNTTQRILSPKSCKKCLRV